MQQQFLPLEPQPPCPAQVQAQLVQMWRSKPRWRERWQSLDALLACPDRARALQACVQRLLVQRQREWLRRKAPQPTTRA
jgi:hypothetical protein